MDPDSPKRIDEAVDALSAALKSARLHPTQQLPIPEQSPQPWQQVHWHSPCELPLGMNTREFREKRKADFEVWVNSSMWHKFLHRMGWAGSFLDKQKD